MFFGSLHWPFLLPILPAWSALHAANNCWGARLTQQRHGCAKGLAALQRCSLKGPEKTPHKLCSVPRPSSPPPSSHPWWEVALQPPPRSYCSAWSAPGNHPSGMDHAGSYYCCFQQRQKYGCFTWNRHSSLSRWEIFLTLIPYEGRMWSFLSEARLLSLQYARTKPS